jgi:hypothetical protein
MAVVRKRTIPTERPPLVGEVSTVEGVAWSAQGILTAVNLGFLDRSRYFFIQVAPQLSHTYLHIYIHIYVGKI